MKKLYPNDQVLLRDYLKIAQVVEKLKDKEEYLVKFYDQSNKLRHIIIDEDDIMSGYEYDLIKKRINTINNILKDD
jgi:hypothetical protein